MASRVVHRVRCRKKNDGRIWADVKVVDAFTVVGPNGREFLITAKAKDADPCIIDKTGGNNGKGLPTDCSRLSHMEAVSADGDSKQAMYVEKLDAISLLAPVLHTPDGTGAVNDEVDPRGGLSEAGMYDGAYTIFWPDGKATKFIVDKTGLNLGEGSGATASRSGHISLVTEKGNTDDKTDGVGTDADSVPPKKFGWLAAVKTDAINCIVPGGDNVTMLIQAANQTELDTTVGTTDPFTHEPCPPDNKDPNIYVAFPEDANGASVKKKIDQGPLWWIERISPTFRPWFWFATFNVPQAFSFFGSPGDLGSWPWRGFVLWNFFPVIWILSRNNGLQPMGTFGSSSLELCAEKGNWDLTYQVPSSTFQGDERTKTAADAFTFGPFGGLPMTSPSFAPPLNLVRPNIWQLTGLGQPPLKDPSKPWNAFTNPHPPPTPAVAELCANTFKAKWNAVANGHNNHIQSWVGSGGPRDGYGTAPPGWSWAVPYFDAIIPANRQAFQNGIPIGISNSGIPLVVYAPATSWTLDIGQLDPKIWDDNHLEFYFNPANAAMQKIPPPFPWAHDPWIGT